MTEPRLISLIVCSDLEFGPPVKLVDPHRRWNRPPPLLWIVADIENATEQSFSWELLLSRRGQFLDRTGETLELNSPSQFYLPNQIALPTAEPRIYGLHWLLNGTEHGK